MNAYLVYRTDTKSKPEFEGEDFATVVYCVVAPSLAVATQKYIEYLKAWLNPGMTFELVSEGIILHTHGDGYFADALVQTQAIE